MKNKEKYNLTELAVFSTLEDDFETLMIRVFKDDYEVYEERIDLSNFDGYNLDEVVTEYYNRWLECEVVDDEDCK